MALALGLIWARPAWAYLDPGAGSYALQIIIASLLGGAFFLRTQWRRLKSFFQRKRDQDGHGG
ncbi:MAG: hypothetical protein C4525_12410 [Desulfarculus sp.]|nr:MAG: hypothetical protein C4525_12410 [Desulfarculus sp.]